MKRISVVGCSGAGKTVVAQGIAAARNIPHIELDALCWGPGWTRASDGEMSSRVRDVVVGDEWVIDGNYWSALGPIVWERADTVVWVDPPRWRVMSQVVTRTVTRAVTRRRLWNGNREGFRGLALWRGNESIIIWAATSYSRTRARCRAAISDPRHSHLAWLQVRTRRDVDDLVRAVTAGG